MRSIQRPLVAAALGLSLAAAPVVAQRTPASGPDPAAVPVAWRVFVGAHADTPARREAIASGDAAAPITVLGWTCTFGPPQRTILGPRLWSESRSLDCARGDARVSTSAACMVDGRARAVRPGGLSLGAAAVAERVDVELECAFGDGR